MIDKPSLRIESKLSDDLEVLVREVIGAAIEVHRHLGPGFLESIYEKALCHELDLRRIAYERQKEIGVPYKGLTIDGQRLDLVVDGQLIVELKTVDTIAPIHEAQLLSYLKTTHLKVGLLINFKAQRLKSGIRRLVL